MSKLTIKILMFNALINALAQPNEFPFPSCHEPHYKSEATCKIFVFDEEERILIASFLPKSLLRVLWTSAAGIDRDARRFQRLGAILDWLTGTYI